MPTPIKEYCCVICSETDPSKFYKQKTLCKQHYGQRSAETRKLMLKSFNCLICGTSIKEDFYPYNKSRCKACFRPKYIQQIYGTKR